VSFFGELKRRNVVKVGIAYLVVAWLLAQVVGLVLPTFNAPEWVTQTVIFLLILGFPIILIVAWAFEITPDGLKLTDSVPKSESITPVTGQRLNYIVTALLAIAVVFLVVDNYLLDDAGEIDSVREDAEEGDAATVAAEETGVLPNSVAVIPCTNLSPNEDDAYFAAAIHEEILNQLVKLSNLNVIARTSVMQYADTTKTIPEIASELNIESVMECSVRYAGDSFMVTAQLIDASTGSHLFSDAYPGDRSDVSTHFALQADIAMNVANALRAEYSQEEQDSIESLPTESNEAYDHYLLAQAFARQGFNALAIVQAIEAYDRALAVDPDFKLAKLGLLESLGDSSLIPFMTDATAGDPLMARVNVVRERLGGSRLDVAVELSSDLPAALGIVARSQSGQLRWADAEQTYREWQARVPETDYQFNLAYGSFLDYVGRSREAIPYLEIARRMDPLVAEPSIRLSYAYDSLGDIERAAELHGRSETLVGYDLTSAVGQAWRTLASTDPDRFGDVLREVVGPDGMAGGASVPPEAGGLQSVFGVLFRNIDDPEQGLAELYELYEQPSVDDPISMLNIGLLAAAYRDWELSAAALRRRANFGFLQFLWGAILHPVHSHPEFKLMLEELGLPDYWRAYGWPEHCRPVGADDFACE
jgi:TolB-like protein